MIAPEVFYYRVADLEGADATITAWSALYDDSTGTITVTSDIIGANAGEAIAQAYYRVNQGTNIPLTLTRSGDSFSGTISSVGIIDTAGIQDGRAVSNIQEYQIYVSLYAGGYNTDNANFKVWNFPGMSVSKINPAIEVTSVTGAYNADNLTIGLSNITSHSLSAKYVLTQSIAVSNHSPISTFAGKFYVNGNTITVSGNFVDTPNTGIFGLVRGAATEIRDLSVYYATTVEPGASAARTGGLVGDMSYGAKLRNIIVRGGPGVTLRHTGGTGAGHYGGVVGHMDGSATTLENIYGALSLSLSSTATIFAGGITGNITNSGVNSLVNCVFAANTNLIITGGPGVSAGGIAGSMLGGVTAGSSVSNCYSRGNFDLRNMTSYVVVGGLFGSLIGTSSSQIRVENCVYEQGTIYVRPQRSGASLNIGGFAGGVYDGHFNECYSRALQIEADMHNGPLHFGGFGGEIQDSTATNCGSTSPIIMSGQPPNGMTYLGGFSGEANNTDFSQCWSEGAVHSFSTSQEGFYTGGFLGYSYEGDIFQCYAMGNVEAFHTGAGDGRMSVGGLVGYNESPVRESFAAGDVTARRNTAYGGEAVSAGGLIGFSSASVINCYATGNVLIDNFRVPTSGIPFQAGGLIGNTASTVQFCYALGSVEVKSVSSGSDYPISAGGILGRRAPGGQVLNTVALGLYLHTKGNNDNDNASRNRILGSALNDDTTGNLDNNYANPDMRLGGADEYWGFTSDDVVNNGTATNKNGADIGTDITGLPDNKFPEFWTNTMRFPPVWNTSSVVSTGYPTLAWE